MAANGKQVFRADHVGSLLRPPHLVEIREKHEVGKASDEELRAVEDAAIDDAIRRQEDAGLQPVTDGEFRRKFFHLDFLRKIGGIGFKGHTKFVFKNDDNNYEMAPQKLAVVGKLTHTEDITVDAFKYLKAATGRTAKVSIPSPTMVHFRGGRGAVDEIAYPDLDEFFDDLAAVYRAEIASLAAAGCKDLQLDDTNLAYLCDAELREGVRQQGDDPDALPHLYAKLLNDCLRDVPDDMTVGIHLCRGNYRSAWVAEGGYEPVAEAMFNEIDVDEYFLEYDDARSGDFAPLRFVPQGKHVVLGLISSKLRELEPKDDIKRRIDEAAKYMPLDQMCLSPQCGFSSTIHGNDLTIDEQYAKLGLVVEIAGDVWG